MKFSRHDAIAVATLICVFNGPAFAERADRDKPAIVDASRGDGDEVGRVYVWHGDVELTKGTITLRADELTIRQDAEGYNVGIAIMTKPGALTYFREKRNGVDEYVEARATRMEYDERPETVTLVDHAVLKMLRSGRDADEAHGDRIVYDGRAAHYSAESGAPSGRARFVLQPKVAPGTSESDAAIRLKDQPAIQP